MSEEQQFYLRQVLAACATLSKHIEFDSERDVFEIHGLVRGHVTGYREDDELYAALRAVKRWSFAEAELDELRAKAASSDAALTGAQKRLEVAFAERDNARALWRREVDAMRRELDRIHVALDAQGIPRTEADDSLMARPLTAVERLRILSYFANLAEYRGIRPIGPRWQNHLAKWARRSEEDLNELRDTVADCRRTLQDIYDLANPNFPANPQTRIDAVRRLAAAALERHRTTEPAPETFNEAWRNFPCVLKPVEQVPTSQEDLETLDESLENAWEERDRLELAVDDAHAELDKLGAKRVEWRWRDDLEMLAERIRHWQVLVDILRGDNDRS